MILALRLVHQGLVCGSEIRQRLSLSLWRRCFLPRYYLFSRLLVPHQGFRARRPENGGKSRVFLYLEIFFSLSALGQILIAA
jgi:hypothetical protein